MAITAQRLSALGEIIKFASISEERSLLAEKWWDYYRHLSVESRFVSSPTLCAKSVLRCRERWLAKIVCLVLALLVFCMLRLPFCQLPNTSKSSLCLFGHWHGLLGCTGLTNSWSKLYQAVPACTTHHWISLGMYQTVYTLSGVLVVLSCQCYLMHKTYSYSGTFSADMPHYFETVCITVVI